MKNTTKFLLLLSVLPVSSFAMESISYSGRLVNSNGSPVSGSVDLRFDLSSTNAPSTTLCTEDVTNVPLSNGVFHVKIKFDNCTGSKTFQTVMEEVPTGHTLTYQVTDLTNSRVYAVQNLHSVPSSLMANFAKNIAQNGALPGQVLKWDDTLKQWMPGNAGSGNGTITQIDTASGLSGGPITTTGTISIAVGGVTNAHLAGAIDPAKLSGTRDGTTYLKGDNTWSVFGTDVRNTVLTGFSAASSAVVAATDNILQAIGKLQGQTTDLSNNKLDKTGGTLSVGTINGVPTPLLPDQIVNKQYVDDQLGGMTSSQWLDASPNIYYNAGNVGIGTGTPAEKLDVVGNAALSGNVSIAGHLRLKDSGSNYVELKAPATTAGVTFTLPANTGTLGQVLKTDGTGILSWGNSTVDSSDIADGSIVDADIAAGAAIAQSKISGLTTALSGKEPSITAGTAAQYWRGDKTWQTLNTDVVPEGATNKYYSNTLARGAISVTTPLNYNSTTGVIGMVPGTTGDLLQFNGTNWVAWDPNFLTAEADTLATVTGRGATTTNVVTLNGGANFPGNGVWNLFGNVGIGTTSPRSSLDVAGGIQIGADATACSATKAGTIRYNGGNVEFCNSATWAAFGVSGSGITNFNGSTVGTQLLPVPGTTGLAPNWVTVPAAGTHTLHIPMANAAGVTAGLISKTDYDAFSAKLGTTTSLSGDVSGTYNATSVDKIKGTAVTIGTLTTGQILKFNGTDWVNSALTTADLGSGVLPVSRGGTNLSSLNGNRVMLSNAGATALVEAPAMTNGQILIGSTGNAPVASTLTAGTGVTITNSAGGITINATGSGGTISALTGDVTASGSGSVAATISNDAVTSAKILDGTIVDADIANSTITYGKLNLADGSIPVAKLVRMACLPGEVLTSDVALGYRCIADNATDTTKLPLAGGTMTGDIVLAGNPTANLHPATKQYVDTAIGALPAGVWATSGSNIYNNNAGNVGVGTNTPGEKLDVNGVIRSNYKMEVSRDGNSGMFLINSYREATNHSKIQLRGARGTQASGAHLQNNDIMGEFRADAWTNGTTWSESGMIQVRADEAHSATSSAGRMEFFVTPSASLSFSGTPNMVIKSSGDVGIGTSTPGAKLDVAGQIKISGGSPGAGKVLTSDAAGLASWTTIAPGGVTSVSGTAPVTVTGTTTPVVSMAAATSSANGYLTSTDWTTFNNKLGTATSFSGDVTGTYNATSVDRIKGTPVTITSLTLGNLLRYNGTAWVNAMLAAGDIPNLDAGKITTGVLPVARGGTNNGTLSGNRIMVSTSTSIVEAPAMTNGQILIGSTGATPVAATLTAGTGVSITNSAGGITINATGSGGTISALTGDVTASGTGSVAATISNNAVTSAKILDGTIVDADIANSTITYGKLNLADGSIPVAKLVRMTCLPGEVITSDVALGYRCVADSATDTTKLPLAGGTMTGAITLAADPTANLHAATKQYVDARATQWTTSGSNIYNSNSGNVGIGTSTPGSKLEVAGQVKITGGTPGAGKVLTSDAAGLATWQTPASTADNLGNHTATQNIILGSNWISGDGGNEGIRIDTDGNIGVGTGTPSHDIHALTSDFTSIVAQTSSNSQMAAVGTETPGSSLQLISNGPSKAGTHTATGLPYANMNQIENYGSALVFTQSSSGPIAFTSGSVEWMRMTPAGNIGIGTNAPGAKLEVAGQVKITGGSPGAGKVLTSDASGLATWTTPTGGADHLGNHTATQNIQLGSNWLSGDGGSEGIFVDSSGNVGIGNVSPIQTLDVISSSNNYVGKFTSTSMNSSLLLFQNTGSSGFLEWVGSRNNTIVFGTESADRMTIDSTGNVGIGTSTPGTKLEVAGQVKITGGSPGAGKVLTSDASGLATWTAPAGTGDFMKNGSVSMTGQFKAADGTFTNPGISFASNTMTGFVNGGTNIGVIVNGTTVAGFYETAMESFFRITVPGGSAGSPSYGFGSSGGTGMFLPTTQTLAFSTSSTEKMRITSTGEVGIGTTTPGSNTKLRVNGQIAATSGSIANGAVNFATGNAITTSFDCGSAISFANIRDGGAYTLSVTGAGTTQCTFSTTTTGDDAATVTYRMLPANGPRTASSHTLYSLQRIGNVIYISWQTGYL